MRVQTRNDRFGKQTMFSLFTSSLYPLLRLALADPSWVNNKTIRSLQNNDGISFNVRQNNYSFTQQLVMFPTYLTYNNISTNSINLQTIRFG